MSSTIDPLIIPSTKAAQAYIENAYLVGQAPDPVMRIHAWRRNFRVGDFTGAGATSQEINLFSGITSAALARAGQAGDFPSNVWCNIIPPTLRVITPFAGGSVSACTIEFGDAGDPNGYLVASDVFTGIASGTLYTQTSAAQEGIRPETAFAPTLTIRTTTANVSALTAGEAEVVIYYVTFPRDI